MSELPPGAIVPSHGRGYLIPFKRGNAGRPLKYTPKQLGTAILEYLDIRDAQEKPYGIMSLVAQLGLTKTAWQKLEKGEFGKSQAQKDSFIAACEYFRTIVEGQREDMLVDKNYATSGVALAMKNHHNWRDDKHLSVDVQETKLVVELDPSSKLARRLQESGGVTVIEGSCEVLADSD